MRYYKEFLQASRMTAAIVFTMAVLMVAGPLLLTGKPAVDPVIFLVGAVLTTVICLPCFTGMNILAAKRGGKKNTVTPSAQGGKEKDQ